MSKQSLIFKPMGQFMREAREARNLSQTEVARVLGVKPQFISNFERAMAGPPLRLVRKLMPLYGVRPEDFIQQQIACHREFLIKNLKGSARVRQ